MTERRERILRAVLPIGLAFLALWVGYVLLVRVVQPDSGVSWASVAIWGITPVVLTVTGYMYRRELDRSSPPR